MKKIFLIILFLWTGWMVLNAQPQSNKDNVREKGYFRHPWQGKRIGYIGDSITDPNCIGEVRKYWSFLDEWLGTSSYVYGVSGRQWDDVPRQAEMLEKEHGNEVDAILVFIGTNDYNSSLPIGEWFTETPVQVMSAHGQLKQLVTRIKRTLVMSNDTYKGSINIGINRLKQLFPNKQIVLLTPLHRGLANFGDSNLQPDENYQNGCGEYIDAYVKALKEAGSIWGVPVIDWNECSGLNPMVEEQLVYFHNRESDRLHPNTLGQKRMASTLMFQLLALPAVF